MKRRFTRIIRYYYLQLQRLPGNPRRLAVAVALGAFIGITPTVPFHMILAITLSSLFRLSRLAALLGTLVSNPLTLLPTYYVCFKIGQLLLFHSEPLPFPETFNIMEILRLGWKINLALQVGGIILALPVTLAVYYLTLRVVQRYRQSQKRGSSRDLHLSQDPLPPPGVDA